jgi:hypothetical protein
MRLSDLEARLQKHSIEPASSCHGKTMLAPAMQLPPHLSQLPIMQLKYIQWGGFPTTVWRTVESFAEADRVSFLCPACYEKNGGKIGTHRVAVDFEGRSTPDEACVHNSEGQPVRWTASGTCIEDLTLSPSIAIIGGCAWHGLVENGATRTC